MSSKHVTQGRRSANTINTDKHSSIHTTHNRIAKTSDIDPDVRPVPFNPLSELTKLRAKRSRNQWPPSPAKSEVEDQVEKYVENLATRFIADIDAAGMGTHQALETLCSRHQEMCNVLAGAEDHVCNNIAEEKCMATDLADSSELEPAMLQERVHEIRKQYRSKIDELDDLWKQWEIVQNDIAIVAIQIYGKDIMENGAEHAPPNFWKAVSTAQQLHEKEDQEMAKIVENMSRLQKEMDSTSERSISQSQQHLKEVELRRKKGMASIKKAFETTNEYL